MLSQPYAPCMKMLLLIFCVNALAAGLAVAQTELAAPANPTLELTRLRHELERRRAEALRPVAFWYRAQLEALQKTSADQSPEAKEARAKALAAAREAFWQDDQPELRQA